MVKALVMPSTVIMAIGGGLVAVQDIQDEVEGPFRFVWALFCTGWRSTQMP